MLELRTLETIFERASKVVDGELAFQGEKSNLVSLRRKELSEMSLIILLILSGSIVFDARLGYAFC